MVPAMICWPSVQRIAAITKDPFFETTKPLNRWTAVEFLRAKQNLKFKTAELTMRIIGKKGMVTALSNLQKQADSRDCVMDDLPLNPAALSLWSWTLSGKRALSWTQKLKFARRLTTRRSSRTIST